MEAIQAMLSRRSIRKYTGEPLTKEQIDTLLKCAMAAPSASNQQPWQFIVVTDKEKKNAIPTIQAYSKMVLEAPVAIIVCGDSAVWKGPAMWPQDCSAATQNILLAAHAMGLGACWCGVFPHENIMQSLRELLGIPATAYPFCIIAVGHSAEEKPPAERYNAARVHQDKW
jgi:nitroreductase